MHQEQTSFFTGFFESGHSFGKDEILLKFQYRVINMVLLVMGVFTFIFAMLSTLGIDPLGIIQTVANYILTFVSFVIIIRLRGPKKNYLQNAYLMYGAAMANFITALVFVPHDEFRIIWFYLLTFAAYITGGIRAGSMITALSIFIVLTTNVIYDLKLSETAIISSVLGLIIASLFFRSYTKKIMDFEQEIMAQQLQLAKFNEELENKVTQKTKELQDLNESLESIVANKVAKITEQERLMIAQSRLATMGEMLSMIAHQWRQPLSTMTLLITKERLKAMVEGTEPSETDMILEKISDMLVYLSDTIDDFQTYFKPDKATQEIAVSMLMERLEHFIEPRLLQEKVTLDIKLHQDMRINTYTNEVIQAFINIINNAIDVLVEKREKERHIWIKVDSADESVMISVEDNGGGIDSEIIDRIFEPYFSKKSKNGTGLGLYMAKMIIEKHIGGTLDVVNTSNGAHFSIVLPAKTIPMVYNA